MQHHTRLRSAILPRIALAYPKIRIVLNASDRFVDVVQEGYDIALRTHSAPLPDSDLVQRRLSTEHFLLVASPSYLGDRDLNSPGQLDGLDGIFSRQDERAWTLSGPDGAVRTVALVPRYVSNEGAAILSAAVAGFGIGALPTFMCEKDLEPGRLVRVAPAWTAGELVTTLIMPSRRGMLPSVRKLCLHPEKDVSADASQEQPWTP